MAQTKYYKWLDADCTNKGFKFKLGINDDTPNFRDNMECGNGLFYTTKKDLMDWFGSTRHFLAEVTIPNGVRKVNLGDKLKSPKINIEKIHSLDTVEGWKFVNSIAKLSNDAIYKLFIEQASFTSKIGIKKWSAYLNAFKSEICSILKTYNDIHFSSIPSDIEMPFLETFREYIKPEWHNKILDDCSNINKNKIRNLLSKPITIQANMAATNNPKYTREDLLGKSKEQLICIITGEDFTKYVGKIGYFWNNDEKDNEKLCAETNFNEWVKQVGFLTELDNGREDDIFIKNDEYYCDNFRPLTQAELKKISY